MAKKGYAYIGRLVPCASEEDFLLKSKELYDEAKRDGCGYIEITPIPLQDGVYLDFKASNRPFKMK